MPDRHGLIIGKFYPPHAGHHELIRLAANGCERVTVVVMASLAENIPLGDRVRWLRAEHAADTGVHVVGVRCDAPLDLGDDAVWAAQISSMQAAVRSVTHEPVTSVWSAEEYGDELARRLGAVHRRVSRTHDALSASRFRADPACSWELLATATRRELGTRVVVVGAESTGTTTIAQALAAHYRRRAGAWAHTACVDEYGREFTEILWQRQIALARHQARPAPELDEVIWQADHFDEVATEQTRRENEVAGSSPLLVCDTDAFATAIWERRYLGPSARSGQPWVSAPSLPRHDLYLVTDHDGVPWHDDGLREGDLEVRAEMTGWFVDALTAAEQSWVLLTGAPEQRLKLAIRTVDQVLAYRLSFANPFTGPGF